MDPIHSRQPVYKLCLQGDALPHVLLRSIYKPPPPSIMALHFNDPQGIVWHKLV